MLGGFAWNLIYRNLAGVYEDFNAYVRCAQRVNYVFIGAKSVSPTKVCEK